MIGIEAIGAYVPPARVDNLERCGRFGTDEAFIDGKLGMRRLAVAGAEESAFELAVHAVEDLRRKVKVDPDGLSLIVVVTQTPGENVPHLSARLHGQLGVGPRCACFDVSLGCSGYVYALGIARSLMQSQGYARGLVVTADPYSKIIGPDDRDTTLLFGDAATATLLSEQPCYEVGRITAKTQGASWAELATRGGALTMNGRAVFTFSAQQVPPDIREALELNGLTIADVDLFVVHQGSRFIVETVRKRLGLPPEKMPFYAADYGNTVSSSIPVVLAEQIRRADAPRRIVISGFGVGLSWASTVLTRSAKRDGALGDHA